MQTRHHPSTHCLTMKCGKRNQNVYVVIGNHVTSRCQHQNIGLLMWGLCFPAAMRVIQIILFVTNFKINHMFMSELYCSNQNTQSESHVIFCYVIIRLPHAVYVHFKC